MENLSPYVEKLPQEAKRRYLEKIAAVRSVDPFILQRKSSSVVVAQQCSLPAVDASDLVSYLVLQTSYLTLKQFKAHKSLEAYNQFANGWVKEVESWSISDKIVVTGKVRHSQRCNETPLSCWMICEASGEVLSAHCTCMAGLGEACTHVAAVLFYLETIAKWNGASTSTQEKCRWIVPAYQKDIPYAPISDIGFSSAKRKMQKITAVSQQNISNPEASSSSKSTTCTRHNMLEPEPNEVKSFYLQISKCGSKPAILSLIPEHADEYIPKRFLPNYPTPLQSLYNHKFTQLGYVELLSTCKAISISLTSEMILSVESATREQSRSKLWYTFRAGRITASKMKAACVTNAALPSQSLIKSICYPEAFRFNTSATRWGCDHEKLARDHYKKAMQEQHEELDVAESGLVLNSDWPHLGASPDGIVNCACCGKGVVEFKCPYCHRFNDVQSISTETRSCLIELDGSPHLDHTHAYYYQVQTQMFVCKVDYCDFCVCTFPQETSEPSMHIERISANRTFWDTCVDTSSHFFKTCILPELLGKWYSRPSTATEKQAQSQPDMSISCVNDPVPLYCFCQQPEDVTKDWIGCDNPNCPIQWFHLACLNINRVPKGKWYCPDCQKLPEFSRNKKRKIAVED